MIHNDRCVYINLNALTAINHINWHNGSEVLNKWYLKSLILRIHFFTAVSLNHQGPLLEVMRMI